jgi:hypothetical protein
MKVSGSTSIQDERKPYVLTYYVAGDLIYYCENDLHGAATSATDWRIRKFTYGADGITVIEQLVGSVTGRAALGWI